MKKLLIGFLLIISTVINAQIEFDYCGTVISPERTLELNSGINEEIENIGEDLGSIFRVIRIPVVVHIVWVNPIVNISHSQIRSQIRILNKDFRGRNKDRENVPLKWKNLMADFRIEFDLKRITRYHSDSNATFGYDDNEVKFRSKGGTDAWDTEKYLNIWVCRLSGHLLGYAQFPGKVPAF